jgi:hypothetical protein
MIRSVTGSARHETGQREDPDVSVKFGKIAPIGYVVRDLADAMFEGNSLPPRLRELAIIRVGRVGRVNQSDYEVFHHERIGSWVGLCPDAISAAATGSVTGLPDDQAAEGEPT